jgi:hypothetical protein
MIFENMAQGFYWLHGVWVCAMMLTRSTSQKIARIESKIESITLYSNIVIEI